MLKHLLQLSDLKTHEIHQIIVEAIRMKDAVKNNRLLLEKPGILNGKSAAMIFSQPSTRTRVSFEVAITQLDGKAIFLPAQETQIYRGENAKDTARVLSGLVDLLILRHPDHVFMQNLCEYATIPIVNALSDLSHPCQLLADIQTFYELRGEISGKKVVWAGDYNNMYLTYVEASKLLNFQLHACIPKLYLKKEDPTVTFHQNVTSACQDADWIVTDTWTSMSDKDHEQKEQIFLPFQINERCMKAAKKDALFMHCLPAYRGKEVTENVLEGENSVVWKEAENRLYAQKSLIQFLFST